VIGGGQVVDPRAKRVAFSDATKIERLRELLEGEDAERVAAVIALTGARSWRLDDLSQRAGVTNSAKVVDQLVESGELFRFDWKGRVDGKRARWLHCEIVAQLESRLIELLKEEHQADPLRAQIPLGRLRRHFVALEPPELLTPLAQRLSDAGQLQLDGEFVTAATWRPQLSAQQTDLLGQITASCEQAGLRPPSVGELAAKLGKRVGEVELLLEVAVSNGDLVRLPDKDSRDAKAAQRARLYLHETARQKLLDRLATGFADPAGWTISQFGEEFGLSRKYAIPLCSHLDQTGVTARHGDLRKLGDR